MRAEHCCNCKVAAQLAQSLTVQFDFVPIGLKVEKLLRIAADYIFTTAKRGQIQVRSQRLRPPQPSPPYVVKKLLFNIQEQNLHPSSVPTLMGSMYLNQV